MGTRSITHIFEMDTLKEKIVCSFFRHFDGYPTTHGQDMADWLKDKGLRNGIGEGFREGFHFNRAGTMAVKLMNHIQDKSGCEVIPTEANDYGEEYIYHILFREGKFKILCKDPYSKKEVLVDADSFDGEKVQSELSVDEG